MPIRMIHLQHGATHAYGQSEVDRLKGYGWVVESEVKAEVIEAPAAVWTQAAEPESVPSSFEPVKRKPGRPAKAK